MLDLFIQPDGSWAWKDAEEFDRALDEGLFGRVLRPILEAEAERVLADHDRRYGAFAPELLALRPAPESAALLPADFGPDGPRWQRTFPVQTIPAESTD